LSGVEGLAFWTGGRQALLKGRKGGGKDREHNAVGAR